MNRQSRRWRKRSRMNRQSRRWRKKPEGPAKPLAEKKAPPAKKQPGAAGDVEVNVGELAARIAGYNLDLRALETDLDESGTWDAARLAPMVDRLKILVVRRGDLDLFREAVPAGKRLDLARLDSPRTASAELGAKIAAARDRAAGASFTGTEAQRRKETDRLDQLSRRLAEAAGK